jgi:hypothetical protein
MENPPYPHYDELAGFALEAWEKLVGAVGIENKNRRNFKDLRGMSRNAKLLKRNDGERKGILIAPLKLPRVSVLKFRRFDFSYLRSNRWVGFGAPILAARMASRHFIYTHALCSLATGGSAPVCFAKIPCALKIVRVPATMAVSSRSSLHPRTPRICPAEPERYTCIY